MRSIANRAGGVVRGQEMSSAQAVQDAVGKHASRAGFEKAAELRFLKDRT
jgi:hypothetical protein